MIMTMVRSTLLFALFAASQAFGCECVEELPLPATSDGMARVHVAGQVEQRVKIVVQLGDRGRARTVAITGGTQHLRNLTEVSISRAKFQAACAGRELRFEYRYIWHERFASLHLPAISVLAGNVFAIHMREPGPIIDFEAPQRRDSK